MDGWIMCKIKVNLLITNMNKAKYKTIIIKSERTRLTTNDIHTHLEELHSVGLNIK